MKLQPLLDQTQDFPVFGVEDCQKWFPRTSRAVLLVQLTHYVKRGYLLRLRRGLYLLRREPRPHPFVMAACLKPGSIISLESVLSEGGIIPETSLAVTAVTDGRNTRYAFPQAGAFIFRRLLPRLLFGWQLAQFPPYSVRVAFPEKALLDLLWFHQREQNPAAYVEGLRLSFPPSFSWPRFRRFAREFNSARLQELARVVEHAHRRL